MKTFVIDGRTLCNPGMDGVRRYMTEVIKRLDNIITDDNQIRIMLAIPRNGKLPNELVFNNIMVKRIAASGILYRVLALPAFVRVFNGHFITMCNEMAFNRNSIVMLHDMIPRYRIAQYPVKSRIKMDIVYALAKKNAKVICTNTKTAKKDIVRVLKIDMDKIVVSYDGYEHMPGIIPDNSVFERIPGIERGRYYYSIGNRYPYKNFKWIIDNAKKHPSCKYVIAGRKMNIPENIVDVPSNVLFVGFVTDAEHKALMMNAKAFVHPSKLEGFGIPPLEALAMGVPIVVASASCLPEVYGKCAHYIDPDNSDVNLDLIADEAVESAEILLKKYTWDNVAKRWYRLLVEYRDE